MFSGCPLIVCEKKTYGLPGSKEGRGHLFDTKDNRTIREVVGDRRTDRPVLIVRVNTAVGRLQDDTDTLRSQFADVGRHERHAPFPHTLILTFDPNRYRHKPGLYPICSASRTGRCGITGKSGGGTRTLTQIVDGL